MAMRTFFFLPPVRQAAGGVTVIRRMASFLAASGREVALVPRELPGEGKGWTPSDSFVDAPVVAWEALDLRLGDLWVVPEGWVNALTPGLNAGARCLVYVQNWAYLLSALPEGVSWRKLPVGFLAVSEPVARFTEATTGRKAPVLRPGVDLALFHAPETKPEGLRIAWMPRKNKALAKQIRDTFEHMAPELAARCRWIEIAGMTAAEVAGALQSSHIFLATGFPEGCPLPPLEAMACGCLCVGYMGFGGADYMRQALPPSVDPAPFAPWWGERPTPWSANGLWSADADILGAATHLQLAAGWFSEDAPGAAHPLTQTLAGARATARAYGLDTQRQAVLALWAELENAR
jgi:hypothetical protein